MVNKRYADAMAETLHYLKGIREEDLKLIPRKFIKLLEDNASSDYTCTFDYKLPIKDLNISDEAKGIISVICLYYWCKTDEEKEEYLKNLKDNEKKYEQELNSKYSYENLFIKKNEEIAENDNLEENKNRNLVEIKENIISKIIKKIKSIFKKN